MTKKDFTNFIRRSEGLRTVTNHLLNGKNLKDLFYGLDISIFDMFSYNWMRKHDTHYMTLLNRCMLNEQILTCLYEDVNSDEYDLRSKLSKMRAIEQYEKNQIFDERRLFNYLRRR